jgi:hypothetical protein
MHDWIFLSWLFIDVLYLSGYVLKDNEVGDDF